MPRPRGPVTRLRTGLRTSCTSARIDQSLVDESASTFPEFSRSKPCCRSESTVETGQGGTCAGTVNWRLTAGAGSAKPSGTDGDIEGAALRGEPEPQPSPAMPTEHTTPGHTAGEGGSTPCSNVCPTTRSGARPPRSPDPVPVGRRQCGALRSCREVCPGSPLRRPARRPLRYPVRQRGGGCTRQTARSGPPRPNPGWAVTRPGSTAKQPARRTPCTDRRRVAVRRKRSSGAGKPGRRSALWFPGARRRGVASVTARIVGPSRDPAPW